MLLQNSCFVIVMKRTCLLFLFPWLICCSSPHSDSTERATVSAPIQPVQEVSAAGVIQRSKTTKAGTQSYACYLPKNFTDSAHYPVLIFFDPHGDGSFPLSKYSFLADRFSTILIGSNNSRNGLQFEQTNVIADELLKEAGYYAGGLGDISFCGFSGGAKVALMAASKHPELLSVVYCGASVPAEYLRELPPSLAIAGEGDLNYTDVISTSIELKNNNLPAALIEWNGKHEWPDSVTFEDVFYWNEFEAMRKKIIPRNQKSISGFLDKKEKEIKKSGRIMVKMAVYNQITSFLNGLINLNEYRSKITGLAQSSAYKIELEEKKQILRTESNMKQNYSQCFETQDTSWWRTEISRMNLLKGRQKMYERLVAYISLAAYSYSSNAVKQNNFQAAFKLLTIYKLADPENSEQPFLLACLYARQGNEGAAVKSLQESIDLGLKDRNKIESEISFNSIRSNPEFNRLLSRL